MYRLRLRIQGLGLRDKSFVLLVSKLEFRVQGLGVGFRL